MKEVYTHKDFKTVLEVYKALIKHNAFIEGAPPKFEDSRVLDYVLIQGEDGRLYCRYRVQKVITDVIDQIELQSKFGLYTSDDIPF